MISGRSNLDDSDSFTMHYKRNGQKECRGVNIEVIIHEKFLDLMKNIIFSFQDYNDVQQDECMPNVYLVN